jgi:hypothetical protein
MVTPRIAGRDLIAHPESLYLDGRWVEPASGGLINVIDPSTEELFVAVGPPNPISTAPLLRREPRLTTAQPRLTHAARPTNVGEMGKLLNERTDQIVTCTHSEVDVQTGRTWGLRHVKYTGPCVQIFRFVDGNVKSFEEYYDTACLNAAPGRNRCDQCLPHRQEQC